MAFPVLESQERTRSAISTSAAVVMPAGITSGDLVITAVAVGVDQTITISSGTGWEKAGQQNITGVSSAVFWKIADGSDALTLEWGGVSTQLCALTSRVSGAYSVSVAYATGTTANPDPPVLDGQDGEEDYLYWLGLNTGGNIVPSAAPTDYSNMVTRPSSGGSYASASCASRQINTSSENPGTFTCAATPWVAWTCALGSIEAVSGAIVGSTSLTFSCDGVVGDGNKDLILGESSFAFTGSATGAAKGFISGVSESSQKHVFTWDGIVDYTGSNAISEWTDVVYGYKTFTNGIYPSLADDRLSVYWNEYELPNDHYAECSSHRWMGVVGDYIGIAVRMSSSAETYYGWYSDSAGSILFKVIEGTYTLLASGDSFFSYKDFPEEDDGERIKLEVVGNELRCYKNDVLDTSINSTGIVTDSDISSGNYAGVCGYGADALIQIDDFWLGFGAPMFDVSGVLTEGEAPPEGDISGTTDLTFSQTGVVYGRTSLSSESNLSFTCTGDITYLSDGEITGSLNITFSPTGVLLGSTSLLGETSLEFSAVAVLSVIGTELSGTINLTHTLSGTLQGSADLSSTESLIFTDSSVLKGTGKLVGQSSPAIGSTIIDHTNTELSGISDAALNLAKTDLNVAYWRASHGSQLTEGGMYAIANYSSEYATKYAYQASSGAGLNIWEIAGNLQDDDDTFVATTRAYLDNPANSHINVVMWAWSGIITAGATVAETISLSIARAEAYIANMETLISEYPDVKFVFMTSNTQVRDPDAWTARPDDRWNEGMWQANMTIRTHCQENSRYLYDFYDIECYDPSGNYFGDGDESDPYGTYTGQHRLDDDMSYSSVPADGNRTNYAIQWITDNPLEEKALMAADSNCIECEHADGVDGGNNGRLTCIQKGIAAWALWAALVSDTSAVQNSGTLTGSGDLTSGVNFIFTESGEISGYALIEATENMLFTLQGDISREGVNNILGVIDILFQNIGDLRGYFNLEGTAYLTFTSLLRTIKMSILNRMRQTMTNTITIP